MKKLLTLLTALLFVGSMWADPIVLFHETFGDNSGNARNWQDSYSVKSGVAAVYSGVGSYTLTNAKQSKNTNGSTKSGLQNTSSSNTQQVASFEVGPLSVANYSTLAVSYQWKAASIKNNTYYAKLYYKTSADGNYTEVNGSGDGATSYVTRSFSLPAAAQVSTLYLKAQWYTSNTTAFIDEFELTGVAAAPKPTVSLSPKSLDFNANDAVIYQGDEPSAKTFTITGSNLTGTDALTLTSTNAAFSASCTTGSLTPSSGSVSATITVTPATTSAGEFTGFIKVNGGGLGTDTAKVAVSMIVTAKNAVTITKPTNGTVTIMHGEDAVSSGDKIVVGETLNVSYAPTVANAYRGTLKYKVGDGDWTNVSNGTITMPSQPITVTADETALYAVSVAISALDRNDQPVSTAGFDVTINGGSVAYVASDEEDLDLVAAEKTGYNFVNWTYDDTKATLLDDEDASTTAVASAACTITANYKEKTAPEVNVSTDEIDFGTILYKGNLAAQSFTIEGANLTGSSISIAWEDGSDEDAFALSATEVAITDGSANATITVTPRRNVCGSFIGQLNISTTGVSTKTIDLSLVVNKLAANLEWSADSYTASIGEENTYPTLSNPRNLSVSYSSAEESAATINAEGNISLVAAGETYISVIFAGNDTVLPVAELDEYYTLTVQQKYTVNWVINGVQKASQTGLAGTALTGIPDATLSANGAIAGKVFKGWATATIDGETDVEPTLYNPTAIPNGGATYYAVYAKETVLSVSWDIATSVTAGDIVVISTNPSSSYRKTAGAPSSSLLTCLASTYNADKSKITTLHANTLQLTVGGNSTDGWTLMNGTDYLVSTAAKKMALQEAEGTWDISFSGNIATLTYSTLGTLQYNYNSGSDRFTTYTSDQEAISLYKKNATYSYTKYATSGAREAKATPAATSRTAPYTGVANGTINVTYQFVDLENVRVATYSDEDCKDTLDGGWVRASLDEAKNITYAADEAVSYANSRQAYIQLTAPAKDEGGEDVVFVVTINQNKHAAVFSNIEDLIASDLESGESMTITFTKVAIKQLLGYTGGDGGLYLDVKKAEQYVEVYCYDYDVPNTWEVGGKLSAVSLSASWLFDNESDPNHWYMQIQNWESPLEYTATYAVTIAATTNGSITVKKGDDAITSGDFFEEGTTLTVEASPASGYQLATLTAGGEDISSTKSFTIGTADVEVVATFSQATALGNTELDSKAVKVMRNGILLIEKNGRTYNAMGQLIK